MMRSSSHSRDTLRIYVCVSWPMVCVFFSRQLAQAGWWHIADMFALSVEVIALLGSFGGLHQSLYILWQGVVFILNPLFYSTNNVRCLFLTYDDCLQRWKLHKLGCCSVKFFINWIKSWKHTLNVLSSLLPPSVPGQVWWVQAALGLSVLCHVSSFALTHAGGAGTGAWRLRWRKREGVCVHARTCVWVCVRVSEEEGGVGLS